MTRSATARWISQRGAAARTPLAARRGRHQFKYVLRLVYSRWAPVDRSAALQVAIPSPRDCGVAFRGRLSAPLEEVEMADSEDAPRADESEHVLRYVEDARAQVRRQRAAARALAEYLAAASTPSVPDRPSSLRRHES